MAQKTAQLDNISVFSSVISKTGRGLKNLYWKFEFRFRIIYFNRPLCLKNKVNLLLLNARIT